MSDTPPPADILVPFAVPLKPCWRNRLFHGDRVIPVVSAEFPGYGGGDARFLVIVDEGRLQRVRAADVEMLDPLP